MKTIYISKSYGYEQFYTLGEVVTLLKDIEILNKYVGYFYQSKKDAYCSPFFFNILAKFLFDKNFIIWLKKYSISKSICIDGYNIKNGKKVPKSSRIRVYYDIKKIIFKLINLFSNRQFYFVGHSIYHWKVFDRSRLSREILRSFNVEYDLYCVNEKNERRMQWEMYYWAKAKFALLNLESKIKEIENGREKSKNWKKRSNQRARFCKHHQNIQGVKGSIIQ